jgi:hypothetical protein
MLLRASSQAIGESVNLEGTIGKGDGGVPHGALLVRFAEAATRGNEDLPEARTALLEAIGPEAFVEAAATVGIFNGLVRVADATGIPLDDGTLRASTEFRQDLGLNDYLGARSTDRGIDAERDRAGASENDPRKLFDFEAP